MLETPIKFEVASLGSGLFKLECADSLVYYDNTKVSLYHDRPDLPLSNDSNLPNLLAKSPFPDAGLRKHLSRLTLNVTKACNLRCEYCYAEYGRYGSPTDSEQKEDEFLDVLESIIWHYHSIDRIQFFGGEPLLALRKIRLATEFFKRSAALGYLANAPTFSVVTNGTLLHRTSILEFLKTNSFKITVSIDGPKEVTNLLRPKTGVGGLQTYDMVKCGIIAARKYGLDVATEGTYTRRHQLLGITPWDVITHVHNEHGIRSVHIAPAVFSEWGDERPEQALSVSDFFDAAFQSARHIMVGDGPALDMSINIIGQLSRNERVQGYCPAFTTQLSIDADGNVYPCFMSMSLGNTRLGHMKEDIWPTSASIALFNQYKNEITSTPLARRHDVWFDSLIAGCAAADKLANRSYGDDANYPVHEAVVAGTILGLAQATCGRQPH